VEIYSEVNENIIVCMTNDQEKILIMFSWHLKPGTNTTSIDALESLPAGSYYIQLKNMEGNVLNKNVLQKEG
jgi:hypothetical protein